MESAMITLPTARTLEECWKALGFVPFQGKRDTYQVDGIYRRLVAAACSIRGRGFYHGDITFTTASTNDTTSFVWEPEARRSLRHWRVTGTIMPGCWREEMIVTGVTIAVKSSAAATKGRVEWTAFTGTALDNFMSRRLNQVFAVLGARYLRLQTDDYGIEASSLTEAEKESWDGVHASPVAAWDYVGRVVLMDDFYGRGRLDGDGAAAAVPEFCRFGWWAIFSRSGYKEIDSSVPPTDEIVVFA
jgi:hypothetical protein